MTLSQLELFQSFINAFALPVDFCKFKAQLQVVGIQPDTVFIAVQLVIVDFLFLLADIFFRTAGSTHGFQIFRCNTHIGFFDRLVDRGVERSHLFHDPVVVFQCLFILFQPHVVFREFSAVVDRFRFRSAGGNLFFCDCNFCKDIFFQTDDLITGGFRVCIFAFLNRCSLIGILAPGACHCGKSCSFADFCLEFKTVRMKVCKFLTDLQNIVAILHLFIQFAKTVEVRFVGGFNFVDDFQRFDRNEVCFRNLCCICQRIEGGGGIKIDRKRFFDIAQGCFRIFCHGTLGFDKILAGLQLPQKFLESAQFITVIAFGSTQGFAGFYKTGFALYHKFQ